MDTTANNATGSAETTASASVPSRLNRDDSNASTIRVDPTSQPSLSALQTSNLRSSPWNSREASPIRPLARSASNRTATTPTSAATSRRASPSDTTPSRKSRTPAPNTSGRVASAASTPKLGSVATELAPRPAGPQKSPITAEHLKEAPRWPVSPRLRSPPPGAPNRTNPPPPRKGEPEAPPIHVQRASPPPVYPVDSSQSEDELEEGHLQPGLKTPARAASGNSSTTNTLETVQEASPLASPQESESIMEKMEDSGISQAGSEYDLLELSARKRHENTAPPSTNDSGSDSGSVKGDSARQASTSVPPALTSRQSSASTKTINKAKLTEGSVQHMTVETETVASIPQVSLAPAGSKEGANGTLRTKPSSETIRPRKEKKKSSRKPNVAAGTASSKADIFEAKIASAVDEHDSSDSEETFVYDSNPPDHSDRPRRYHSRTPSATSMVSQVDRNGMRSLSSIMDNAGPSAIRRNMKFVNTFNSSGNESAIADEEGKGTARTASGSGRGSSRGHHHHYGRWGRNSTNGHASLFDNDAPFHVNNSTAQRAKFSTANSRQSSGPPSPRFINAGRLASTGKRGMHSASYDLDETTGADDERTPLIHGSVRSSRSGRGRRQPMSMRGLEGQSYHHNPSMLNRFASCLVLTVMLLLVVSGAIGFMFATSQPLTDVELKSINTVIASQTELMFDLSVKAHNPNVVVVVIDQADIEVFAKSPHAGTDYQKIWPGEGQNSDGTWGDGHSHHSDAKEPVDDTAPNMRLGSIVHLDSPLSFEGSFFNQGVSASTGEVRLVKPGNGTFGGPERWESILQEEFDLIIKGVLKYSLPLSQRVRSVTISGRTTVKPNSADNPDLKPNQTEIATQARAWQG